MKGFYLSHRIEKEIQHLLSEGLSTKQIATSLATRALDSELKNESLVTLCLFLYRTGEWELLSKLSVQLLKEKQQLAIAPILKTLLRQSKFKLDDHLPLFIEATRELKQQQSVLQALYKNDSKLVSDLKLEFVDSMKERYEERKKSLLEKLNFFKADNMFEQERITIKEIEREFPELDKLSDLHEDFKRRWSESLINNRQSANEIELLEQPIKRSPQEELFLVTLKKHCLEHVKIDPNTAYDFALMFYFFSALEHAIDILDYAPSNYSVDWLIVEWLLEARRFVEALNYIKQLEVKYEESPDNAFACAYAKARVLWGLKKYARAIDEMTSLVNIRPEYRSAKSLLTKWNGGLS